MNEKLTAARFLQLSLAPASAAEICDMLEYPADRKLGDVAFPCFKLSKTLRKAPQKIAEDLCAAVKEQPESAEIFEKIENVNGYLNFYVSDKAVLEDLLAMDKENFGSSEIGKGKTVVIDYSSPNIAKPFHIGHLRSTVIGQSIKNIHRFCGYNCVGVNHLGDWGTQFGKLIVAYKKWGNREEIETRGITALTEIYVNSTRRPRKTRRSKRRRAKPFPKWKKAMKNAFRFGNGLWRSALPSSKRCTTSSARISNRGTAKASISIRPKAWSKRSKRRSFSNSTAAHTSFRSTNTVCRPA